MAPAKTKPTQEPETGEKRNGDSAVERKSSPRAGKFRISIYDAWCKQCGLCVDFCPKGALVKQPLGSPLASFAEQCIGCKMCVLHCPDFAISITAKDEAGEKSEG
jgi:2-oxoglutarate ferredoxin oxidoreductase subunit delta